MKRLLPYGTFAVLLVLVGLLANIAPARMPQALAGGDFLSVLLGDAKKDISNAMVHEADSYFHGGVDMDCHHLHGHHNHSHDHGADCTCDHCSHDHHAHHDESEKQHDHDAERFDPWMWINTRIRAPEIDRHLEGRKAVELMPWFWVAIKSDPHNVEAWSTAWYVAAHIMKDDALAVRIASEGWRLNPESLEMACVLGRAYRAESTRDTEKSEAMFLKVLEMVENVDKLEDSDLLPFYSAVGFLTDSAKKRKDIPMLERLHKVAHRISPKHPTTLFIEKTLRR